MNRQEVFAKLEPFINVEFLKLATIGATLQIDNRSTLLKFAPIVGFLVDIRIKTLRKHPRLSLASGLLSSLIFYLLTSTAMKATDYDIRLGIPWMCLELFLYAKYLTGTKPLLVRWNPIPHRKEWAHQ